MRPLPPIVDSHLPRAERRFPFRAARPEEEDEVREAIGQAIEGVEGMLWLLARQTLRRLGGEADIEDEVQQCRLHLFTYSLPRFDASRHSKVTTFARSCIANFFARSARNEMRKRYRRRRVYTIPSDSLDRQPTSSTGSDRPIERLAGQIMAQPEAFLNPRHAAVLQELRDHPEATREEAAERLGLDAYHFNHAVFRTRRRISQLAERELF